MRYPGKPGSKKWRGITKRRIDEGIRYWNMLLDEAGSDLRLHVHSEVPQKGTLKSRRAETDAR